MVDRDEGELNLPSSSTHGVQCELNPAIKVQSGLHLLSVGDFMQSG